jgi:hypothetical protein
MNPGGKDSPQQINVPPFTSTGGITPQQQTLANYTYGQDLGAQANLFGGSGTGMSTMATQGATGAKNTEAQQQGSMSDTDAEAMYKDYQNQVSAEEQSLQNDITLSNQNSAGGTSLASLASSLFGTGTNSTFGQAAAAGVGADTPNLTDSDFSGLTDAMVLGA